MLLLQARPRQMKGAYIPTPGLVFVALLRCSTNITQMTLINWKSCIVIVCFDSGALSWWYYILLLYLRGWLPTASEKRLLSIVNLREVIRRYFRLSWECCCLYVSETTVPDWKLCLRWKYTNRRFLQATQGWEVKLNVEHLVRTLVRTKATSLTNGQCSSVKRVKFLATHVFFPC